MTMSARMGGNNSRTRRLTRFLRRSERDRSDTEEDDDDDEGWSEQPHEDETTGDDFDSGNVQNMIRHLLRYGLISRTSSQLDCRDEDKATQQTHDKMDTSCDLYKQVQLDTGRCSLSTSHMPSNVMQQLQLRQYGSNLCCTKEAESVRYSSYSLPECCHHLGYYNFRLFCGIHSPDGSLFALASQDHYIHLLDSSNGRYQHIKKLKAPKVGWSVLDICFSSDQCYLAYSTWSSDVFVCNLHDNTQENGEFIPMDLRPDCEGNFGVFAVKFSGDGQNLLASGNDGCLYIYNRERNEVTLKIQAHEDDVNSTCYSSMASQLVFSGSDDGQCKVWDLRCNLCSRPVGVFAGHKDGISHVESKRDNRYLITNSKDQTIKLWDLRKFSDCTGIEGTRTSVSRQYWDYRWQQAPRTFKKTDKLVGDTSVMTYRGHRVLQTAIRCRFSPLETTGNRYIYTGSAGGSVIVYDILTGEIVSRLKEPGSQVLVRDTSWHPHRPELVSVSWDGIMRLWDTNQTTLCKDDCRS